MHLRKALFASAAGYPLALASLGYNAVVMADGDKQDVETMVLCQTAAGIAMRGWRIYDKAKRLNELTRRAEALVNGA